MTSPCHPLEAVGAVYIEVPKAGCTSLKYALATLKGGYPPSHHEDVHRWFGYTTAYDTEQLRLWLNTRWAGFYRFTVVRHPFARFESFFYDKVSPEGQWEINEFVQTKAFLAGPWKDDVHAQPQTDIMGRRSWYDFVGHCEDMRAVERALFDAKIADIEIPRRNRSRKDRDPLDPETRRLLRKWYAADFRFLGYE